ncbi:MAG TPA: SAM-dependent DNA methyltransferase, partial [Terriglobia bacterium]|nr:SAM-dependent DNA methyltransferase [Terriglobia bacterium]
LTRQTFQERHLVLYNHSGMNVAATYFDRQNQAAPFIVDVKLYWAAFSNPKEADYVAAILNSETVNAAIKPFQSVGLLGERDIHKKLLELPIPIFNHENPEHRNIAEIGANARKRAAQVLESGNFPLGSSIGRQRNFMRECLKPELDEIDKLVSALLD